VAVRFFIPRFPRAKRATNAPPYRLFIQAQIREICAICGLFFLAIRGFRGFRGYLPEDNEEMYYWIGADSLHDDPGYSTPGVNCCDDSPWCCWEWEHVGWSSPTFVHWQPEEAHCPTTSSCFDRTFSDPWIAGG
jgi:hypothetical protein